MKLINNLLVIIIALQLMYILETVYMEKFIKNYMKNIHFVNNVKITLILLIINNVKFVQMGLIAYKKKII